MSRRKTDSSIDTSNRRKNVYGQTVQTTQQETQLEKAKKQLCINKCTPIFYYKGIPHKCDPFYNKNTKEQKCFTDTPYENFYNKIDWMLLHSIIERKADEFSIVCGDDPILYDMINRCYNPQHSIYGGRLFLAKQSNSGNANYCNDIIISFKIPCIRGKVNSNFQLFHIALHSRMPYFNKTDDRNVYACGYGIKNVTNVDCGPFHYKIDNNCVNLGDFLNMAPEKGCYTSFGFSIFDTEKSPYKKFIFNQKNATFINNTELFNIPGPSPVSIDGSCMDIHRRIYSKFVNFWNTSILPEVILPGVSLPVYTEDLEEEANIEDSKINLEEENDLKQLDVSPSGVTSVETEMQDTIAQGKIGGKKRRSKKRRSNKRNNRRNNKRYTNKKRRCKK